MPLIIITGLPCSGKTHRALQIATDFSGRISSDTCSKRNVVHLPSNHARFDVALAESILSQKTSQPSQTGLNNGTSLRDQIYSAAGAEKTARAAEFSAIKRALSRDAVVIADGLNYIKGYRYQLWCEAKAAGTRCCVVHVAAGEDEVCSWNRERLRAWNQDEEEPDAVAHTGTLNTMKGELVPESHTAGYGDRVVERPSKSRSSSIDGMHDGQGRPEEHDRLTLMSLSLRDNSTSAHNGSTDDSNPPLPSLAGDLPAQAPSTPPPSTSSPPYTPTTLASLLMRYEPPSPFSRWDTPLFTVPTSDTHPPFQSIWDAIFPLAAAPTSKKALSQLPRPQGPLTNTITSPPAADDISTTAQPKSKSDVRQHAATMLPASTAPNALQELESASAAVVSALLAAARAAGAAGGDGGDVSFRVPDATAVAPDAEIEAELCVPVGLVLSQPLLQRLRRRYTAVQRGGIAHGVGYQGGGRRGAVEGFVRFLEGEWGGAD